MRIRHHPTLLGVSTAVVALAVVGVARFFRLQVVTVRGTSMEPSLLDGARILARGRIKSHRLKVGQVVVASPDSLAPSGYGHRPSQFLKRIAAVGPSVLQLEVPEDEHRYISQFGRLWDGSSYHYEVPAGRVFLLSDNLIDGVDSRLYGPVEAACVTALAGRSPVQVATTG